MDIFKHERKADKTEFENIAENSFFYSGSGLYLKLRGSEMFDAVSIMDGSLAVFKDDEEVEAAVTEYERGSAMKDTIIEMIEYAFRHDNYRIAEMAEKLTAEFAGTPDCPCEWKEIGSELYKKYKDNNWVLENCISLFDYDK